MIPAPAAQRRPSRREAFELLAAAPISASWAEHGSLRDPSASPPRPHTIDAQWALEGEAARRRRLLAIFDQLSRPSDFDPSSSRESLKPPTEAEVRRGAYARELWTACGGDACDQATWKRFESYALQKERDLFALFADVDRNGDGVVDRAELRSAADREGLELASGALEDLFLAVDRDSDGKIRWEELRDAFLRKLLPRKVTVPELLRYHEARRPVGRHITTLLTSEGDLTVSEKPPSQKRPSPKGKERETEEEPAMFDGAGKFLLAGGIAGAVSRTATAPFDRLKIYLITRADATTPKPEGPAGAAAELAKAGSRGMGALRSATTDLYSHGGIRAFWVGNGLNMVKIFPESAIKFLTYESMKRVAAGLEGKDSADDISSSARFVAGGIGGATSQASIYWLETLKTRAMATAGTEGASAGTELIIKEARAMRREPGSFNRGLSWAIVGSIPYSGVDMALFEFFKVRYATFTGRNEPGTLASLLFGACSGGIGASAVYPLCGPTRLPGRLTASSNLIRTRLQAQGTPSHPQRYTGIRDAVSQTMHREGVRGFYKSGFAARI